MNRIKIINAISKTLSICGEAELSTTFMFSGINDKNVFLSELDSLRKDGLVSFDSQTIRVNENSMSVFC